MPDTPQLGNVVLDTEDPRALAEFYRQLLGWRYRSGDEPPPAGEADERGADWLVLRAPAGAGLAFQAVPEQPASTWPDPGVPQMLHLDLTVPDVPALEAAERRVLELGGTLRLDRREDPDEPLLVFSDPSGHPFCVFVA